ncbi:MAG: hypothetical protein MI924_25495, partial [Chloroflexales bacterium]|nr:hypothetical protein [Chloroflexales bacterium]
FENDTVCPSAEEQHIARKVHGNGCHGCHRLSPLSEIPQQNGVYADVTTSGHRLSPRDTSDLFADAQREADLRQQLQISYDRYRRAGGRARDLSACPADRLEQAITMLNDATTRLLLAGAEEAA